MATLAFAILEDAFFRNDFSFNVVAEHSSTTTPTFYKLAAAWSSQEGSLLLWVFLLSLWSSLILFLTRNRAREITAVRDRGAARLRRVLHVAGGVLRQPVPTTSAPAPTEGAGLDPLLLHPSMMIHPPMLYSGYTLLTIPFAFAIGALITGPARRGVDLAHPPVRARRLAVPGDRDPARRALVLHRARLGRLLGLGSGRERGADAVAVHHRVHPLDHDPGEAGDAEGLERVAGAGAPARCRSSARSSCARGSSTRSTRSAPRRSDPVRGPDRGDGARLDLADPVAPRPAALRRPARLAALARGRVPVPEPGAGRRWCS